MRGTSGFALGGCASLYRHIGVKPADEYSSLELHIAILYGLVEDPDELELAKWKRDFMRALTEDYSENGGDYHAALNRGNRERRNALRRRARLIFDQLGESEEAIAQTLA